VTSRLYWVPNHLGTWLETQEIKKNSVVTGIESTTSGLLDQRRNRSDNQANRSLNRKDALYLLGIRYEAMFGYHSSSQLLDMEFSSRLFYLHNAVQH